ncbi:MAG TPA: prolipoprotein diacylglyceryl transferase family protein [Candidatus Binatia bacterium]|nr:prolipoprotein diacylglyceryl transferase family protein [Candidatus Binatia bacterium]
MAFAAVALLDRFDACSLRFASLVNPHLLFWTLGCATGFVAGCVVLRARGALRLSTLLALGWAWGGLLVGAKLHYRLEGMSVADALWLTPAEMLTAGMRLPLGLLVGGVLAGGWCLLVGAPWRQTGDALAVAASVAIPIGRIGCLANGCCTGGVCIAWPTWLCTRYGPGTETYAMQLGQRLISSYDAVSLPAHPLPIYFALASLVTLAVLVVMLRRGAPPGALLAVFCVVRPATKLALEPLRATPRPQLLMVGIPMTVLVVTCVVLGVLAVRRRATTITTPASSPPC